MRISETAAPSLPDVTLFARNPLRLNARFGLRLMRRLDGKGSTTQDEVAKFLDVPSKTYRAWENGSNDFDRSPARGPVLRALQCRWMQCLGNRVFFAPAGFGAADCQLALDFVALAKARYPKMGEGDILEIAVLETESVHNLHQLLSLCYTSA